MSSDGHSQSVGCVAIPIFIRNQNEYKTQTSEKKIKNFAAVRKKNIDFWVYLWTPPQSFVAT